MTYGYGHENPAVTSYPSQLAAMLGNNYEVGNFGKSGATLLRKGHRPYNEQEEFQKALEFAPDIAIIHLGLNDTDPRNWKYYKREFISDYVALIEAIENSNPDVDIFICRMTPIFHWHHRFQKGTRDWYWEIQATIENIAENIAEMKIIDLQELLYHRPDLMPDALHPNEEGARLIAQRIYSAITGDFGGLSVPAIYSFTAFKPYSVCAFCSDTINTSDFHFIAGAIDFILTRILSALIYRIVFRVPCRVRIVRSFAVIILCDPHCFHRVCKVVHR